ncbi:MAG: hypothetical protein KGY81_00045 [Phycisphaerae bacterium]|nr:hypothetical protein [Phycisphaerae bacterium]
MKHAVVAVALLLAATTLTGCLTKEVDVTFRNQSDRALEVHLNGAGEGTGLLGTMDPGGTVGTTLKVPRRDMPVLFTWTAGPFKNAFTVWQGTSEILTIDVGADTSGE